MFRTRTAIAASIAVAASSTLVAGAAFGAPEPPIRIPVATEGFESVHSFGGLAASGTPVTMDAVRPGEVWLAMQTPTGHLIMTRARGPQADIDLRRPLGFSIDSDDEVVLDGSGHEAWLSAAGTLWRLESRTGRWRQVSLGVSAGSAPTVTTVVDAAGPGAYAGLRQFDERTGRYRSWVAWTDGRKWRALTGEPGGASRDPSAPIIPGRDPAPYVNRIRVADGSVVAEWRTEGVTTSDTVYVHRRGAWRELYPGGFTSPHGNIHVNAWLVSGRRHLQLGEIYSGSERERAHHIEGFVNTWTPKSGSARGTVSGLVGAAAQRTDGQIVLGTNAYKGEVTSFVSGFFLRAPDGGETPLTGDAGHEVIGMSVEPISDVTWALTRNGETVQLQRYAP
ncbi:MAG: hypothetical protein Q4G51_08910 [Dermatophilus congolensis]|nr:hypothetical protein [Dermatophilus congolensis]